VSEERIGRCISDRRSEYYWRASAAARSVRRRRRGQTNLVLAQWKRGKFVRGLRALASLSGIIRVAAADRKNDPGVGVEPRNMPTGRWGDEGPDAVVVPHPGEMPGYG
jgi:hypothetical protein